MRALPALFVVLLCGCATTDLAPVEPGPAPESLDQDYYQVNIPTHDGERLRATVYQPELEPGETAPLIIASHGYGGMRASRPWSFYGQAMLTGQAALEAWREGYWVVFYNQRGFGGSSDSVNLMDPDKEVRDPSTILDWALEHLPGIASLPDGNPAVGMVGESYGGGSQILASFEDDRLGALVPIATWHDLPESFAPNGHVRTYWGGVLATVPAFTSRLRNMNNVFGHPYRGMFTGTMPDEARRLLYERSPAAYCNRGQHPEADALLIQGFRDTIMTMDQALANRDCFREGGRDARLMAIQGGHILPWPLQRWSGKPLFNTDSTLTCDGEEYPLEELIVHWWDEKLRGAPRRLPDVCLALDYENSTEMEEFPDPAERFRIPRTRVHIPIAGLFEGFMVPADRIGDIFRGLWPGQDLRFKEPQGGFGRPKFIPLHIVRGDDEVLLGTPRIDMQLGGTASRRSTRVFLGVGVQHRNKRRVEIASEQITPLPSRGRYQQELAPVSRVLEPGDRVGLVIYGYNWQYFTNPSYWWSRAILQGDIELPLDTMELDKREGSLRRTR